RDDVARQALPARGLPLRAARPGRGACLNPASRAPRPPPPRPGAIRQHAAIAAPLRIAHLTATFPPYRGGAGHTAFRLAVGQAERGHHVEVFTALTAGEAPDPGRATVHRFDPAF